MACNLFITLGAEEVGAGPEMVWLDGLIEIGKRLYRTGNQAAFDQVGCNCDVGFALLHTLLHGPHGMADLQTQIP